MKVCYFIQTHKNPHQIYRLVQTIKKSSPTGQVLIGHDFTSCYLDMALFEGLPEVALIKGNTPVIRGNFSLLQPYHNAINWLFESKSDFDWLVYLSGQDYPTQPLSTIEDFLSKTEYDGFIQYFDVFSNQSIWDANEGIKRYFYQYYHFPNWTKNFLKKTSRIQDFTQIRYYFFGLNSLFVGLPSKTAPFNDNFKCYGGSQWHTLSRKCVQYIKDFFDENPNIINHYKKTFLPDESVIQTILINSNLFKFFNGNKRYIDFYGTDFGHPRLLTTEDYETITNGKFHFARKFEPDTEILDMLDFNISQDY